LACKASRQFPLCKEEAVIRSEDKAGRRIRTDDLLITNQLLYQLSYAGISSLENDATAAT
jgi:hypothetical protein